MEQHAPFVSGYGDVSAAAQRKGSGTWLLRQVHELMGRTARHSNRSQVFAFFDACEPATQFCNTLADRSASLLGKLEELARRLVSGDMAFSFFGNHRRVRSPSSSGSSNARARALEATSNSA